MSEESPPLEGIRVVDLSDEFGAYAGRLLAGLGAEVVRLEEQSRGIGPPPHVTVPEGPLSLFDEWANGGKVRVEPDPADRDRVLFGLVESADVVIDSSRGRSPGGWTGVNPRLVHVVITPFGWGRSPSWEPVDDLIVLARGGLLDLGGYEDGGPVGPFGGQSYIAAGTFGAVAALVGLLERDKTGEGNAADVSAQEVVAQALEDSLPTYVLTGQLKSSQGDVAREAGTGIYACADGYVSMVAGRLGTARAWASLVEWLDEEHHEGQELTEGRWSEFAYRQSTEANERFREVFEDFAAHRTKMELYLEAQGRGIALSPVNDVSDLLDNEQLQSRDFFQEYPSQRLGTTVTAPGHPFRLSRSTQPQLGEMASISGGADTLIEALGLNGYRDQQGEGLGNE